jgi:hypothetical protein
MLSPTSPDLAFSSLFRPEAAQVVEYSFSSQLDEHGVMVPGGPGFLSRVQSLAASLPFAGEWITVLGRLVRAVHPDAYLFRTDWSGSTITALTAYCRFPSEPDDTALAAVLSHAYPLRWQGPPAGQVAQILGLPGPRGLGVGVDHNGRLDLALYFRVPGSGRALGSELLSSLAKTAGMAPRLGPELSADMSRLYAQGMPMIVGLDSGKPDGGQLGSQQAMTVAALKFNPPNVPLESCVRFLNDHGADSDRLRTLVHYARALRARWASYLGIRYSGHGFSGWRLYLSVAPQRFPGVSAPRWTVEAEAIPTLALPHY